MYIFQLYFSFLNEKKVEILSSLRIHIIFVYNIHQKTDNKENDNKTKKNWPFVYDYQSDSIHKCIDNNSLSEGSSICNSDDDISDGEDINENNDFLMIPVIINKSVIGKQYGGDIAWTEFALKEYKKKKNAWIIYSPYTDDDLRIDSRFNPIMVLIVKTYGNKAYECTNDLDIVNIYKKFKNFVEIKLDEETYDSEVIFYDTEAFRIDMIRNIIDKSVCNQSQKLKKIYKLIQISKNSLKKLIEFNIL